MINIKFENLLAKIKRHFDSNPECLFEIVCNEDSANLKILKKELETIGVKYLFVENSTYDVLIDFGIPHRFIQERKIIENYYTIELEKFNLVK